jgi:serine/threonine protein kinase
MPFMWGKRSNPKFFFSSLDFDCLHFANDVFSYLHSKFSPPIAHSNLKAANVLLDEELVPRLCDCGLAVLRPLTSNRVKIKVSTSKNWFHACCN